MPRFSMSDVRNILSQYCVDQRRKITEIKSDSSTLLKGNFLNHEINTIEQENSQ
jgi:hypothetical protein